MQFGINLYRPDNHRILRWCYTCQPHHLLSNRQAVDYTLPAALWLVCVTSKEKLGSLFISLFCFLLVRNLRAGGSNLVMVRQKWKNSRAKRARKNFITPIFV